MNLSATIAKMRAAGMSSEAIVQALECIVIEQVTPERSGAARRQAAYRERVRERNALRDVDNNVTDKKGFDKEIPPTPPKEITSQKINPTSRAKAKSDLPDDWQPDAKTWMLADELGFTSQEAWDQLERMRDWAKNADGGKGRKSDWNAAFRNWLKRASDDRRNRPQNSRQRNGIHATLDAIDACADEAIRRAGGYGTQGGEEDFDELPGLRKSAA